MIGCEVHGQANDIEVGILQECGDDAAIDAAGHGDSDASAVAFERQNMFLMTSIHKPFSQMNDSVCRLT